MSIRSVPAGLVDADFDYIAVTYTSTTDVYTYRDGGVSGTVVKVVTVTYSDADTKQITTSIAITG
jgi:hypothetical protein